ncbi:stip1 likey and u-box containing 1 [Trichoderma arundinaceum]|uniref:Stip1 likey and u-box containing 1 n=1 Tax=Trichoderma arundinaceum TaxID=490622 RepID=A0A395NQX3_TRIAR|nr:stip1 likey and u-box containing 1 [Trichoderma arundinaceum]
MSKSLQLKEEGNRHFQAGDYIGADGLYSKAIIADSKNPALYTNRAMARLKLGHWDSVITDCQTCLALAPQNMKAHYYLAQAQLSIGDYDGALENALAAHKLCAATNDKSLGAVTNIVLRCKKDRWEHKEKLRLHQERELQDEMLALLARDRDEMLMTVEPDDQVERRIIEEEASAKIRTLSAVFENARTQSLKRREVPDWAIDDISFGIMVDPVITKTGKSYERATILEHLRRHPSDPLTREPLSAADLRPNLALRQACEEFLEQNGWAVDW